MKTPKSSPKKPAGVPVPGTGTKVMKNVNRSPVKAKPPSSANGGVIETFETAAVDIVISVVSKRGSEPKQGAYIKPLIDAWRNGEVEDWQVDSVIPRRDGSLDEPMKSQRDLPYNWECIISLRGSEEETPTEIGRKLAASFSSFSSDEFKKRSFVFVGDISNQPPLPLNHYLLDRDVVMYLKKIYFGCKKDDISEDDEILTDFFGSPTVGKRVLSEINEAEWNEPMW